MGEIMNPISPLLPIGPINASERPGSYWAPVPKPMTVIDTQRMKSALPLWSGISDFKFHISNLNPNSKVRHRRVRHLSATTGWLTFSRFAPEALILAAETKGVVGLVRLVLSFDD